MHFHLQTERDVSVRQRAVDLLYAMCDRSNAEEIVSEMLAYLETADYSIREEMVRGNIWFLDKSSKNKVIQKPTHLLLRQVIFPAYLFVHFMA